MPAGDDLLLCSAEEEVVLFLCWASPLLPMLDPKSPQF